MVLELTTSRAGSGREGGQSSRISELTKIREIPWIPKWMAQATSSAIRAAAIRSRMRARLGVSSRSARAEIRRRIRFFPDRSRTSRPEELFALRQDDFAGGALQIDEAVVEGGSSGVKTYA